MSGAVADAFGDAGSGRIVRLTAIYASGVLIGLIQVAVPSSSAYLTGELGLTGQQYGQLFLAQLVAAIAGALLAGPLIRSTSLHTIYTAALVCFAASQLALAASVMATAEWVQIPLLVSLALFGFGFGFGGGPLNGLVAAALH